jgi:hypothetical protein
VADTLASRALDELLEAGGALAETVKEKYERTTLWRWRNGHSTPLANDASDLDKLTKGRVPADGWSAEGETAPPESGSGDPAPKNGTEDP